MTAAGDGQTPSSTPSESEPGSGHKPLPWLTTLLMVIAIVVALAAVVLRITLVRAGVVFGANAVAQGNVVTGLLVGLAAVLTYHTVHRWRGRSQPAQVNSGTGDGQQPRDRPRWGDHVIQLAAVGTAIVTFVAAINAGINVYAPQDPPWLATAACPSVRVWGTAYVGTNAVDAGVNTRSGPGRSYPPNGRLPGNCSVGYSAYCIGDPIRDGSGSTEHSEWVDTRWLLLAKNPKGIRRTVAGAMSGERAERQFVAEALVNPLRPYDDVKRDVAGDCPGNAAVPGAATLEPLRPTPDGFATLTAHADHAANVGFAVWRPTGQDFLDPDTYLQLYNGDRPPSDNPGTTDAGGNKTVVWPYRSALVANLQAAATSATVVVMAVACLSDNVPDDSQHAAVATYSISRDSNQLPTPTPNPVILNDTHLDKQQLARTACQAII